MEKETKKNMEKETKKNTQIVKRDDISNFISQAIEQKLPVEAMERLFNLYKDVKKERAKEAFVISLTNFQKECPVIKKTKEVLNRDGKTVRYRYAPIDSVIEQIKEPLAKNGFSYNWDSVREEKHIKVVCKLTHIQGHTETSTFDIPIVESQYMTSPQSYATAQSYAKRYTLLNVLGIATADEDNDAQDTDDRNVKSQKARIVFLLRGLGYEVGNKKDIEEAVKKLTGFELKSKNFQKIINELEAKTAHEQGL